MPVKSEDDLRSILDDARNQTRREPRLTPALRLWMTDCAAHTLHIYEATEPHDFGVRNELIQIHQRITYKTVSNLADETRSWIYLQEIAQRAAHQNLSAAAWAVRSVAWAVRDIKTAWNCAAAATKAIKCAFPECEASELSWQVTRLNERLEHASMEPIQPGKRYHPLGVL